MAVAQESTSAGLIEAARTDKMAFSALFRRHYDEIFRYCARRLPSRDNAEDVTSQVFLKMVSNFDTFTGDEPAFRCWLFRIACNEINTFFRSAGRQSKLLEKLQQESVTASTEPDDCTPDDENQAKLDFLQAAIGTMKPGYQDILTLRFFQNLNSEQIAEILDVNPATVRSRLSRSLKHLKKLYRRHQQQPAEDIFSYDKR